MNKLETERLILRPPVAGDLDAYANMWIDRKMLANVPIDPQSRAGSWSRLLRVAGSWALSGYGQWLVFAKDSGDLIGQVGYFDTDRGYGEGFDEYPEAGWMFMHKFWGKGYATESMLAAQSWMDQQAFVDRTSSLMGASQTDSINVAEKCGYMLLRKAMFENEEVQLMIRKKPVAH